MKCPCGSRESRVIDGRNSANGFRRRRECKRCGTRFSTFEVTLSGSHGSSLASPRRYEKDQERKDAAMRILVRVDTFARELSDAVGGLMLDDEPKGKRTTLKFRRPWEEDGW